MKLEKKHSLKLYTKALVVSLAVIKQAQNHARHTEIFMQVSGRRPVTSLAFRGHS